MEFKKVSVIGLGYIGLPTAAVLASRKINVVGVDVQQKVVDTINRGEIHIIEPDLDMVVKAAVNQGYLRATNNPESADAFLVAVPTPIERNHEPNLSYIEAAVRSIAPVLQPGNLVILESTSPVGTTERLASWLAEERPDLTFPQDTGDASDVRVAHCPERVLPGHILSELVQNDRVVGGMTERCSGAAVAFYEMFVGAECLVTDSRTAEMCKLIENSYRDLNIAFANELSIISARLGINVWDLIELANHHPRVNILKPGPGVGGHCIAVDPWFIVSKAGKDARLIRTARRINDEKPQYVVEEIVREAAKHGKKKVICLGITFKPDIDDIRESPSIEIAKSLAENNLEVSVIDPNIDIWPAELLNAGVRRSSLSDVNCDSNSAVVVALVAHREFKQNQNLKEVVHLDFCGLLSDY